MQLMGLTPGSSMDHGATIAIGGMVHIDVPIGSYACQGHHLDVTLTPTLVAPAGALRPRSTVGASTVGGNGSWSPAGNYTLNLRGTVLFT